MRVPMQFWSRLGIVAACCCATNACAQCVKYECTLIVAPPCGFGEPASTSGYGLSEDGLVCGDRGLCTGDTRPMLWQGTSPAFLTLPAGFEFGRADAVNSLGTVAGRMLPADSFYPRGFISVGGATVDLGLPRGTTAVDVAAMNEASTIVGHALNPATGPLIAFKWQNGAFEMMSLPIGPNSAATSINDRGDVAGWMGEDASPMSYSLPFVVRNANATILPLPEDAAANPGAAVTGLNNRGDACGYYFTFDRETESYLRRGCAWIDGQVVAIGTLPGYPELHPRDINDAREIVGSTAGSTADTAFIWRNGVIENLNARMPPGSPTIVHARAINNKGQVTGSALAPGNSIAFLLTPALPAHAGDTNCDGSVNVLDLLAVINHWNPPGPVGGDPVDLNRDNRIDHLDLLETIFHWGQ